MLATAVVALAVLVAVLVLWVKAERGRLLLPSTWRLFREGIGPHGYVYGRWTRQYIDVLLNRLPSGKGGARWLSDRYHGKVLTHDHAVSLVCLEKDFGPRDLEQVVPAPPGVRIRRARSQKRTPEQNSGALKS